MIIIPVLESVPGKICIPTTDPGKQPAKVSSPPTDGGAAKAKDVHPGLYQCLRALAKSDIENAEVKEMLEACNSEFPKFSINSTNRIVHFLAQCGHESGNFWWLEEIASGSAYEWRDDLGNNQPGDGKRYKGRGLIQLTGKTNYQGFEKKTGHKAIANPEQVAKYPQAMASALYFWDRERLNEIADQGMTDAVCKKITRIVNGGYNGLDHRLELMHKAKALLS